MRCCQSESKTCRRRTELGLGVEVDIFGCSSECAWSLVLHATLTARRRLKAVA